jgi:hypothetical protein
MIFNKYFSSFFFGLLSLLGIVILFHNLSSNDVFPLFLGCGWEMKDSSWRISEFSEFFELLKLVSKKIRFSEYWN